MMPIRMRSLLLIAVALIAGLPAARADTPLDVGSNILIEAATAIPARQGEFSCIRFRIVNDSTAAFHIIGIDTPLAQEARLVAHIDQGEYRVLDSIGVAAGETLDLSTSHLWYEVGPIVRDLRAGETFDITLKFVEGQLTVPVHVHRGPAPCPLGERR